GWNKSDVTVSLAASDNANGSSVASITYDVSGAPSLASTTVPGNNAQVTISTPGATTITYFATDVAGNVGNPRTLVVKLDETAPTITMPRARFVVNSRLTTTTVPVQVYGWVAADTGGSGLHHHLL